MDETKRFLRYVIPGLLFIIEVSFYTYLSAQERFIIVLNNYSDNIALPVSVFLISGGIGFLLSIFYYALYHIDRLSWLFDSSRSLIKDCVKRNWLRLENREDGSDVDADTLSHIGAWNIVTGYWHARRESSPQIKSVNSRTDSLADVKQGLGSAFIGSILSIPLWLILRHKLTIGSCQTYPILIPLILSIIIVIVHFFNFIYVRRNLEGVVSIVMTDDLRMKFEGNGNEKKTTIINISLNDLKRKYRVKIKKS